MADKLDVMRRILDPDSTVVGAPVRWRRFGFFAGVKSHRFVDRYWTVETQSAPIQSIAYEGSGTGGMLICDGVSFSLNDVTPGLSLSVGSTKDNQLALATSGNVFPFGPLTSTSEDTGEHLATAPPPGDQALLATRHSVLSWPTPFDMNFMTGQSPSWKRHIYQEIRWKKSSGSEAANALALRAILLSRQWLDKRIHDSRRLRRV